MSRAAWKPGYVAPTYMRYLFINKSRIRKQHVEMHFITRYFYYILLDPNKYIRYNIFARSSTIIRRLCGLLIRVYRGHLWRTLFITRWHVGYKFGEFGKTRAKAVFRSKTLKKKKSTHKSSFLNTLRIDRLRLLKSGKVRKQRISIISGGGVIH